MNNIIKMCLKKYGIKYLILLCFISTSSNATLISLESASNQVFQNEIIELELWARNLNGELISGFEFDINFNTIVTFQGATFGSFLGNNLDSIQDVISFSTYINIAEASFLFDADLFSQQGGNDFLLASLRFLAVDLNTANFSVISSDVIGANYTPISILTSPELSIDIVAQQVPEPNTLVLLFIALISGSLLHRNCQVQI